VHFCKLHKLVFSFVLNDYITSTYFIAYHSALLLNITKECTQSPDASSIHKDN